MYLQLPVVLGVQVCDATRHHYLLIAGLINCLILVLLVHFYRELIGFCNTVIASN